MEDEDIEIEYSTLSQSLNRDGVAVEIQIYRIEGSGAGWTLEVEDEEGGSTVWDDEFKIEQAALDEVMKTIKEEGMSVFLRPPDNELN
jgi:hypothetical protein